MNTQKHLIYEHFKLSNAFKSTVFRTSIYSQVHEQFAYSFPLNVASTVCLTVTSVCLRLVRVFRMYLYAYEIGYQNSIRLEWLLYVNGKIQSADRAGHCIATVPEQGGGRLTFQDQTRCFMEHHQLSHGSAVKKI